MAGALMVIGAAALAGSLFLVWSHQFSHAVLAVYGNSPVLAGVPRNPDGWQVYSIVDVLMVVLSAALAISALIGGRSARVSVTVAVLIALAFVMHALKVPPTNGADIYNSLANPPDYVANHPSSGPGEVLALLGLVVALIGLALSFTAD